MLNILLLFQQRPHHQRPQQHAAEPPINHLALRSFEETLYNTGHLDPTKNKMLKPNYRYIYTYYEKHVKYRSKITEI